MHPSSTSKHLIQCTKSTYLSTEGDFLNRFEQKLQKLTGSNKIILTNTGTSALQVALNIINVNKKEVLVPSMTFVASTNAIIYNNGVPHFIDCQKDKISIDHDALDTYLNTITHIKNNKCFNTKTVEIVGLILVHGYSYQLTLIQLKNYAVNIVYRSLKMCNVSAHTTKVII